MMGCPEGSLNHNLPFTALELLATHLTPFYIHTHINLCQHTLHRAPTASRQMVLKGIGTFSAQAEKNMFKKTLLLHKAVLLYSLSVL